MDLMAIRRGIIASQQAGLDTSPKILQYDASYVRDGSIQADSGYCVTDKYSYDTISGSAGALAYQGMGGRNAIVYKNGGTERVDYWALADAASPRNCLNVNSDAIAFTLFTQSIDDSYAYIVSTGQILFAGKNTQYYGHRNISELSE